jgi:ATP-dependent DNA helicase PIF1
MTMTMKNFRSLILLLLVLHYESAVSLVLLQPDRPLRHGTRLSTFDNSDRYRGRYEEDHLENKKQDDGGGDVDGRSSLSFKQADALEHFLSLFSYSNDEETDLAELSRLTQLQAETLKTLLSAFPRPPSHDEPTRQILVEETDFIVEETFGEENVNREEEAAIDANNEEDSGCDTLSSKQAQALDLIKGGHNVFITGVAGTGKSLVLQRALDYFRELYQWEKKNNKRYVAVAPTGPTALALGGQTIHSFAGIGIPKTQDNFSTTRTRKDNAKKWKELKVLVLDECSMVSGEFLDRLSDEVSMIRKDPRPFGGIQLIICGDFLQLPPIPPRNADVEEMRTAMEEKGQEPEDLFLNRGFAFQSHTWSDANFRVVELDVVFRQKNKEYVNVLNNIRRGHVTREVSQFLQQCSRPLPQNEFGIRPTILHSRNKDVSRENLQELQELDGESYVYYAEDSVNPEKGSGPWVNKQLEHNQFFKSCIAEQELQLRIGAQVMLIKRFVGSTLVNGSRGSNRLSKGQGIPVEWQGFVPSGTICQWYPQGHNT